MTPGASTLSEVTGPTEGVRLGDLLDAIQPGRQVVAEVLAEVQREVGKQRRSL